MPSLACRRLLLVSPVSAKKSEALLSTRTRATALALSSATVRASSIASIAASTSPSRLSEKARMARPTALISVTPIVWPALDGSAMSYLGVLRFPDDPSQFQS